MEVVSARLPDLLPSMLADRDAVAVLMHLLSGGVAPAAAGAAGGGSGQGNGPAIARALLAVLLEYMVRLGRVRGLRRCAFTLVLVLVCAVLGAQRVGPRGWRSHACARPSRMRLVACLTRPWLRAPSLIARQVNEQLQLLSKPSSDEGALALRLFKASESGGLAGEPRRPPRGSAGLTAQEVPSGLTA